MRFGDGQLYGAIAVLAIVNILSLFWTIHKPAPVAAGVPYAEDGPGKSFAEIAGDTRGNGIYFVPEDTNILELLEKADTFFPGAGNDKSLLRKLEDGTKVVVDASSRRVMLEKVSNSKRYALHKPMDLNTITERELMLVPGIGGKTARAIIETRKASGRFSTVDGLMDVPGIGSKKCEKFREYFFAGNKS